MRRLLPLSLLAAAALLARSAVAEDPKTYTLPVHETWRVGDVVSQTSTDKKVQKQQVKTPDGKVVKDETTDATVGYERVVKVLEVDDTGRFTKAIVFFSKWSSKKNDAEDDSLEGKHVEVAGLGATRTVKVVEGEASPEAITWLEQDLGKRSHSKAGEAFTPKKAVAVGESWSPDFAMLQKAFGNPMTLVPEKSTGKVTLSGVDDGVAALAIALDLQVGPMETPQGKLPWKDGGKLVFSAEGRKPLDPGKHAEDIKMTTTFGGTIDAGGATVVLDMTMEETTHTESGGEMPPVPEAK